MQQGCYIIVPTRILKNLCQVITNKSVFFSLFFIFIFSSILQHNHSGEHPQTNFDQSGGLPNPFQKKRKKREGASFLNKQQNFHHQKKNTLCHLLVIFCHKQNNWPPSEGHSLIQSLGAGEWWSQARAEIKECPPLGGLPLHKALMLISHQYLPSKHALFITFHHNPYYAWSPESWGCSSF